MIDRGGAGPTLPQALSRFGLAGLLNTAFGFAVIVALDLGLGAPAQLANLGGYLAGLGLSYALSHRLVFQSRARVGRSGPRFIAAAAAAFLINQAVLAAVLHLTPQGEASHLLGHLAGMAAYSFCLFALCRLWVFADQPEGRHA
jgi:putative flippase GtrA